METVQAVVDIGLQVSDIVRTEGKIAATKSATEALNRAGTKELAAAKAEWQKANPDKTPTQDDIVQQLYQTSYNKAMLDSGKGTGGALQQGISAATAAASALAGASGGAAGEYIAQQLYPGIDRKDLSEEQRQTISALGTLAAGLAGGLAGDGAGSAVTGAQAGKNAVENNNLAVLRQGAILAAEGCTKIAACRNALIEKGLGSLLGIGTTVTVLDKLSDTDKEYLLGVAATGRADLIEKLTPEQRVAYDYMVAQDQKGLVTIFPAPDKPLTIGSLENPLPENRRGTTLTTPDQRGLNGATNTGNTEGAPDTGGNTTVTPVPNGPNKDDLAYLSTGENIARENANEPIRFIDSVNVRDIKTGENFSGTVDLKPTLDRIQTGGSYPHRNDGTTFQNRPDRVTGEAGLPPQQPGYYKEYVHPTPGISGPGPQRIVVGQKGETYYTNDHYKTFIRIK